MDGDDGAPLAHEAPQPPNQEGLPPSGADPGEPDQHEPEQRVAKKRQSQPGPPAKSAGPATKRRIKPQVPSDPKQDAKVETISWSIDSIDSDQQREETVGLEELLASTPIGALMSDHAFRTTGAPAYNTIGMVRLTHEVKDTQLEVYQNREFFTGPRFAVGWKSNFDIQHCAGDFGELYRESCPRERFDQSVERNQLRRRSRTHWATSWATGLLERIQS